MIKRLFNPVVPVFTLVFSLFLLGVSAQEKATEAPKVYPKNLGGQYQEMIDKSNNFQGYKVVKIERLASFRKNVMDTIAREKQHIAELQAKLNSQTGSLSQMKASLGSKDQQLEATKADADQISFIGIPMNKSSYSTLMWGALLVLVIALAVVIFQSTGYRREAKYRIKLFDELSEEYRLFKTKSNDKEKKLARELQDERNKLEELSGRY
ncbi:MAG: hypothetical protein INR69_08455 [Mucilaginibacter polytrichastri]|nr:hypothetical protein [Mucilaginibacter polytrichastri]